MLAALPPTCQLKQLALTRAHNLLEYEVIWGHIDILVVVVRRLRI